MDFQGYLEVFRTRVEIYKQWNEGLKEFMKDKEYNRYSDCIHNTTMLLRKLREDVKSHEYYETLKESIKAIEALEDQHLKENIAYHMAIVQGKPAVNHTVKSIEEEIMESIQELTIDNSQF